MFFSEHGNKTYFLEGKKFLYQLDNQQSLKKVLDPWS
jgi:hypothetical protein